MCIAHIHGLLVIKPPVTFCSPIIQTCSLTHPIIRQCTCAGMWPQCATGRHPRNGRAQGNQTLPPGATLPCQFNTPRVLGDLFVMQPGYLVSWGLIVRLSQCSRVLNAFFLVSHKFVHLHFGAQENQNGNPFLRLTLAAISGQLAPC